MVSCPVQTPRAEGSVSVLNSRCLTVQRRHLRRSSLPRRDKLPHTYTPTAHTSVFIGVTGHLTREGRAGRQPQKPWWHSQLRSLRAKDARVGGRKREGARTHSRRAVTAPIHTRPCAAPNTFLAPRTDPLPNSPSHLFTFQDNSSSLSLKHFF